MFAAALAPAPLPAYETDAYYARDVPLRDARAPMNRRVNEALEAIVRDWRGAPEPARFVDAVYRRLGGLHWVDRIERWVMDSAEIDKHRPRRAESVFAGHPWHATRVTTFFGVGVTFEIDGARVGSDKLGHFFSQGRKFWKRWRRLGDEAAAAERSAFTERAIFGQLTTGDYSNADLVANYEGHRFYRSLFEDDVVAGKPAILRVDDGRWVIQRAFDWRDHVNPWWDEALLPSHFDRWLYPHMRARLAGFCADYARDPAAWSVAPALDRELAARYAHLRLRDARELRLQNLCAPAR